MKGNPKVLAELNKALREELTAINQYFLHAEMCENWGYRKLSEFIKKQSIGEMKHAEVLIERILFLDGSPSMMPLELKVGGTVKGMLESDLALEVGAVKQYNDAVAIATKEGDNGSRDLLVQLAERRGRTRRLSRSSGPPDQRARLRAVFEHADGRGRGRMTMWRGQERPRHTLYFTVTVSSCAPLTT